MASSSPGPATASRLSYRPLEEEIRHFRAVSEKYKQLQSELVRNLQEERQLRCDLEKRLQEALESERLERELSQSLLGTAREYVRLDNMAKKLTEENKKLKNDIQEMKTQAEVESGVVSARTAAWQEQVREATRRAEQEQQAAKEVARQAREQAEQRAELDIQERAAAFAKQLEAMKRSHLQELEALRAEMQSIRNECNEQVNVAALEFEERAAQLADCIATLESERAGLRDQISGDQARMSQLQTRLDEAQRSLDMERTRLLEANRTILAQRQAQQAQQVVRFQPASTAYPPLSVERLRQNATPRAAPPPQKQHQQQRRVRRKAFESSPQSQPHQQQLNLHQQQPQAAPARAATPPSLFTFKRRFTTPNPPASQQVPKASCYREPPASSQPPQPMDPTPSAPADFLRHLSRLPASKKKWTLPPADPVEAQQRPVAAPPAPRPVVRGLDEELEVTRRFFSGRSWESSGHRHQSEEAQENPAEGPETFLPGEVTHVNAAENPQPPLSGEVICTAALGGPQPSLSGDVTIMEADECTHLPLRVEVSPEEVVEATPPTDGDIDIFGSPGEHGVTRSAGGQEEKGMSNEDPEEVSREPCCADLGGVQPTEKPKTATNEDQQGERRPLSEVPSPEDAAVVPISSGESLPKPSVLLDQSPEAHGQRHTATASPLTSPECGKPARALNGDEGVVHIPSEPFPGEPSPRQEASSRSPAKVPESNDATENDIQSDGDLRRNSEANEERTSVDITEVEDRDEGAEPSGATSPCDQLNRKKSRKRKLLPLSSGDDNF